MRNFARKMELSLQTHYDFVSGRLESFYAGVYPSLLLFAARALGDMYGFLAEDCVQDAIYKAYQRRSQFSTPSYLKSFLYQCVHNEAVSILRKHNSKQRYVIQQDTIHDFRTAIIEQETLDLLFAAIEELPADLREVFHLSFEDGLTNQEAGARMGISESAVKKKKAKMISMLRERFKDNGHMQMFITLLIF